MADIDIIFEALNDFIKETYSNSTEESVVLDDIKVNKEDLNNLDMNNPEDVILKKRVDTKIRDLEEKLQQNFFKKLRFPREYYDMDLNTKIDYLNTNHSSECPKCKMGELRLVPSGMQWRCTNRCGMVIWTTTEEREFLKVSPNN